MDRILPTLLLFSSFHAANNDLSHGAGTLRGAHNQGNVEPDSIPKTLVDALTAPQVTNFRGLESDTTSFFSQGYSSHTGTGCGNFKEQVRIDNPARDTVAKINITYKKFKAKANKRNEVEKECKTHVDIYENDKLQKYRFQLTSISVEGKTESLKEKVCVGDQNEESVCGYRNAEISGTYQISGGEVNAIELGSYVDEGINVGKNKLYFRVTPSDYGWTQCHQKFTINSNIKINAKNIEDDDRTIIGVSSMVYTFDYEEC